MCESVMGLGQAFRDARHASSVELLVLLGRVEGDVGPGTVEQAAESARKAVDATEAAGAAFLAAVRKADGK